MKNRYDTDHLTEAKFETGLRGRVLKNILGICSKRAGNPIAVWRDGKAAMLKPEEIPA